VREVCSRAAVSFGVRLEYSSATDFAIEEEERTWLRDLDLDLLSERGLDGGSGLEASMVGRFDRGNKLPPGLADREMRGHPMTLILRTGLY